MWPFNLSVRLLIVDLVGRYLTNYLIRREPIFQRISPLITESCDSVILCGISSRFQLLSPSERQVAHVLLTRPPLLREQAPFTVRLACVRRAASVRPEPGSNSLLSLYIKGISSSIIFLASLRLLAITRLVSFDSNESQGFFL